MNLDWMKRIVWKLFFALHEKKYTTGGRDLRYLFKCGKSNNLCVVFSAFPQKGNMPGYNYIRTLWDEGTDLLFICDDMVNIPTGGSYYLGNNGDYWGIKAVKSIVDYVTTQKEYDRVIGIGSSKGGTAALMFGLELKFNAVIIGACQYKIGSYLNCLYHYKSLQALTGMENVSDEAIVKLDGIVKNILSKNKGAATEIWFHYSTKEHTYEEQIKELLQDLRRYNYILYEDIADYNNHSDVAKYYPVYLLKTLDKLLVNKY